MFLQDHVSDAGSCLVNSIVGILTLLNWMAGVLIMEIGITPKTASK